MGGGSATSAAMPPLSHSQGDAPAVSSAARPKPVETVQVATLSTVAMAAAKPVKKHHSGRKKKKRGSMSELTPLIVKGSSSTSRSPTDEEIYPLPWFRSPEWTRKPSPLNTNDKRRKAGSRFRRGRHEPTSLCNAIMAKLCCGLVSADSDADLELGTRGGDEQVETDGFKQCVQFLVGLIVVVAAVLIVMIIFQPFQQDSSLW